MAAADHPNVDDWLAGLGLADYAPAFRDNDVDMHVLSTLTMADLREIGVVSVGHRRRILDAAARLGEPPQPPRAAIADLAVRRQLTVMFCDLVDSTALSVSLDPEDYGDFIRRYRAIVEEAIRPFNGHVAHLLGDGILVYFGYPRSFEHDAENAVAAGLAILERIATAPAAGADELRVRIGIATGLTVVAAGDRARELLGDNAIGEIPNLAARMQALATANSLIIAPSTRRLVGDLFDCSDLGLVELKGFDRPVRAWQVHRRSGKRSRFEALRTGRRGTAFIDREIERSRLRQWLVAARAGRGQVAVITGEGGLGKSRLARHIVDEMAQGSDQPVLQCTPYNVGSPFHPVRYYIERLSGLDPGDQPDAALRKLSALLGRAETVTPERLALIAELTRIKGADLAPLQGLSPQERRSRMMRALAELLEAILRDAVSIVIEDIQWIDPSTAELIEGLLPTIEGLPVLLICTMRPGPLPSWLAAAQIRAVHLERLPPDDVRTLVATVADGIELPASVVEVIATRSDGIPIYAEELTRGYLEASAEGRGAGDELSNIPATLADSLLARLDRLKQGHKVASIAAAIGREYPIEVLVAVTDLPEAEVRAAIDELLDADVLMAGHSPFGEAIAFRHMLVRDAAYQLLLRRDRTALHARIAMTLSTQFPQIADALPHVVAIQLAEAGDFEHAALAWERAGSQAAKRSAYSEAVGHFSKAIEANARRAQSRERDEQEFSYRLNLVGAIIAARGFAAEGVAEEMEHAVALSRKLGTTASLIPALTSKWVVLGASGNVRGTHDLALQIGEAAADGSEVDRLLAHRVLGTSLLFSGDFRRAITELEQFVALYDPGKHEHELRKVGPSGHAIMTMVGLAEIHTLFAEFEIADGWRVKAIEAARGAGQLHDICNATLFAGCLLAAVKRDDDELARYAAELKSLTASHELPFWRGHADLFSGLTLVRSGRADEGFVAARRGVMGLVAANAFMNGWYILYAEACEEAGLIAEGAETLARAAPAMEHGELWFAAEYHRVAGRLALAGADSVEKARLSFNTALQIAEAQGARLFAGRARNELASLGPS